MQFYLGGHLSWYDPQKRKQVEFPLAKPTLLTEVLANLNVPVGEIAVGVINGNPVFLFENITVTDSDKIELYPPVGGGTRESMMPLRPSDILKAEFDYIAQTAFQANEDRARVSNFYFVTMGAALGAILSARFDLGSVPLNLAFAGIFAILTFVGWSTLMQMARLRTAWQDSIRAMNVIKDYYLVSAQEYNLDAAFLWRSGSIPTGHSKQTISYFLTLSILAISFGTTSAVVVYLGVAILGLVSIQPDLISGAIVGILSIISAVISIRVQYKQYAKLVTETEQHQRERYQAHLEKYKAVLTRP